MIVLLKTSGACAATLQLSHSGKQKSLQEKQNTMFWICFLFATCACCHMLFAEVKRIA